MRSDQVLAIIPAYNEASRIGPVIEALQGHGYTVLVVDDGSRDATAPVAAASGAVVVRQANGGKGAAMRLGCAWAARAGYRRVLLLDGDGQHDPDEAGRLLAAARLSGAEVVIGKRTLLPARQPAHRRCFNRLSSLLVTLAAGHGIRDSQSGYRLLDPTLLLRLPLQGRRYDLESEFCILACRAGVRLVEVPITVIYLDKRSGVHPLWDTMRFFYAVGVALVHARSRLRRFRPERAPRVTPLRELSPAPAPAVRAAASASAHEPGRTAFG